jgi:hypothetical protein
MREFSVTIEETGRDVPVGLEERLELFLADCCTRGLFGRERGAAKGNLHWQGIVETQETTTQQGLHRVLKRVVWGPGDAPQYAHVKVTAVTGRSELHTFVGMLGYCTKDSNEGHFREVRKNVSDDLIAQGKDIYVLHGSVGTCERLPVNFVVFCRKWMLVVRVFYSYFNYIALCCRVS